MSNDPTLQGGVHWLAANRDALVNEVRQTDPALAEQIQAQIDRLAGSDAISAADMFEMQTLMNQLSQSSEMTTSVIAASNSAIANMASNVKS